MPKHALDESAPGFVPDLGPSASVFDVAEHILTAAAVDGVAPMSTMKLQKLVYFCQAWSLGLTGKPMFPEAFEAWPSGPVCRELFELHEGECTVGPGFFYAKLAARDTADADQPTAPAVP